MKIRKLKEAVEDRKFIKESSTTAKKIYKQHKKLFDRMKDL